MAVIFPDIEPLIVDHLTASLALSGVTGVRIGTKKLPAGTTAPATAEVVVIGNYTGTLDDVRSDATLTIDVYSQSYANASEIGLLVGALIVQIPGEHVKRAVVSLGPVRLEDEAPLEKRSLSVDLIVKGSTL
jgi:hypothetical protein